MAKRRIRGLLMSYDMGINKFYDFLDWCYELKVSEVTLYALSLENLLNRDRREIETLLRVFNRHAVKGINDKKLHENRVRVNFCGDKRAILGRFAKSGLAREMIANLTKLQEKTKDYRNLTLNLAIGYGGRQEILNAVRQMVSKGAKISEANLRRHLWVKSDPDLIIRTSEERLSNFLMWQSAYSEIYFVPKLWQEFRKQDLVGVLEKYESSERRYGG